MLTQELINSLSNKIVGCAIEVHKHLGAGWLESVYESCLVDELTSNNINVKTQILLPVNYKAQLLTYLKLTKKPKGLLINFNSEILTEQLVPLVTEEFAKLPKQ
ncbi:MAG TPA: GxxExxY protein [Ignavibacteriaceae bacterium]|nr:GxxExxY protein [Ignavibacteriaceae bacterium]